MCLETKAYNKKTLLCLLLILLHCWNIVTGWHWPVVLGYPFTLLYLSLWIHSPILPPLASASCLRTSLQLCISPLATPPAPLFCALGGLLRTVPGCVGEDAHLLLAFPNPQNPWRQRLGLIHLQSQRLAQSLCHTGCTINTRQIKDWRSEWFSYFPLSASCTSSVTQSVRPRRFIQTNRNSHWIELIYGFWPHQFFYFSGLRKTNYVCHYQSAWNSPPQLPAGRLPGAAASGQLVFSFGWFIGCRRVDEHILWEEECGTVSGVCGRTSLRPQRLLVTFVWQSL